MSKKRKKKRIVNTSTNKKDIARNNNIHNKTSHKTMMIIFSIMAIALTIISIAGLITYGYRENNSYEITAYIDKAYYKRIISKSPRTILYNIHYSYNGDVLYDQVQGDNIRAKKGDSVKIYMLGSPNNIESEYERSRSIALLFLSALTAFIMDIVIIDKIATNMNKKKKILIKQKN